MQFTKTFDVWYDNSSSFYKISSGWVLLSSSFSVGVALLKELFWVIVVL